MNYRSTLFSFSAFFSRNTLKMGALLLLALMTCGNAWGQNSFETDKHLYFYHIWSFLKYQHPALATGKVEADSLFLRYLPAVDEAKNQRQVNAVFKAMLRQVGPSPEPKVEKLRDMPVGSLLLANLDDRWYTRSRFLTSDNRKQLENIYQRRYTQEPHHYTTIKNNPFGGTLPHEPKYEIPANEGVPYEFRMLALAKVKGAVDYLYPYKYVMDENWDMVVSQMIPLFAEAKSRQDYEFLLLTLNAKLNDTQAYSFFRQLHNREKIFKNRYYPPFDYEVVEGRILVTGIIDQALAKRANIKVGDVIEELDEITVPEWVKALETVLAVSNQQALWHRVGEYGDNLLFRSEDTDMKVLLTRGKEKITTTLRLMNSADATTAKLVDTYFKKKLSTAKPKRGLEMVTKNVLRFKADDTNRFIQHADTPEREAVIMDSLFKVASKAKGIIFDMRYEPDNSEFVYTDVFRKFGKEANYFAKYYLMNSAGLGSYTYLTKPDVYFPTTVTPQESKYKGKVIILVNGGTQSVGEWLTMNLQHIFPNSLTLGETTAGADGDLKRLNLPGNYVMEFSGNAIFYPDNTPTQRKGLRLDQQVSPTIKGTLARKDELLEKALELINEDEKKTAVK